MLGKLGKYEVRGEIGRGAMGAVYEGFDAAIGRRVAIKVLRTDTVNAGQLSELLERFRREAQAAGRLSHPHIVTIHDYGEDSGTPFIVMEHISGRELAAQLDGGTRFTLERIQNIMQQLLGALAHAHRHGIVHRDLKPSNIFLLQDGSLKVVDFGIARVESSDLTDTGAILGTPAYMSPEQCLGVQVDHRSDLYSAGVILYQLLTGEKPFTGSVASIIQKILRQEPLPPSDLNPIIAAGWDGVVARAMAKKPEARFQSALQFADALARVQQASAPAHGDDTTVQLPAVERTATEYPATVPLRLPPKAQAAPAVAAPQPSPSLPPPEPRRTRLPWLAAFLVLAGAAAAYFAVVRAPGERPAPAPAAEERETPRAMEERIRRELEGRLAAERAAADKAAAEAAAARRAAAQKAAAEKAAAQKAAAERAAAERAVAEKAAAEKAAAEKAAAEKAAAEKAAAEKAAAEKAAAEKAAAEKAAAEKAAAEKAAAEKAAAERAARQRAAAQKAAAEKAAAEKAAAAALAASSPRALSWSGRFRCEPFRAFPAQNYRVYVKQNGDEFTVGFGTANKAGSLELFGERSKDGTMRLDGKGLSSRGGTYNAYSSGQFSGNSFEGEGMLGTRRCTLTMSGR